jgi:L-lactate utilization protein LutB
MSSVFLLEPSTSLKRRHVAEVVSEPRRAVAPGADQASQRLMEIRQYALDNLESLVRQFQDSLAHTGRGSVRLATSAAEAAEYIGDICGPTRTIAINKSAAVTKELAPALRQAGFEVSESYFQQFPSFHNRFEEYWQLPSISPVTVDLSLSSPIDLNALRQRSLARQGVRDMVAVLGVGAASAADGSLFLLQHGRNITDIFQQARKVILVVGLDKVTAGLGEAAFQTRCMALFGAEAVLMDLQAREDIGPAIDEMPVMPPEGASPEIDILLLDNGRSHIMETAYRQLLACINCRACIKDCPAYKYFSGPLQWGPKEYVYFFALGQNHSLDLCLQCGMCRSRCPLDIDVPRLIALGRSQKRQPVINRLPANFETVARQGSAAPWVVNTALSSRPLRWLAHVALGLSKDRQLPRFQKHAFARWYQDQVE